MSTRKFRSIIRMLEEQFGPNVREVDDDHWLVEVSTRRRRSQVVHVQRLAPEDGQTKKDRLVAESLVGRWHRRYDAQMLLRKNAELDVGAVCLEELEEEDGKREEYLIFRASRLLQTADNLEVWEMIAHVARTADELESDIFAFDRH